MNLGFQAGRVVRSYPSFDYEKLRGPARGEGKGILRAARFDGARWTELPVLGPDVSAGANGFYLQSVATPEGIRVLWRKWEHEQTLGLLQEGPGPLAGQN